MNREQSDQNPHGDDHSPQNQTNTETVPMVLITLPQRDALIEFMSKLPYADVANGIEFLRNAPQVNVNLTTPAQTDVDQAKGAHED